MANRLIDRFDLSGSAAESVHNAFEAPIGSSAAGLIGAVLVLGTALSFTRAMQRLYESCWRLDRRGLKGSGWGLAWLGEILIWIGIQPYLDLWLPEGVHLATSLAAAVVLWLSTPYLLLGRRVHNRLLAPGAALTAAAMTLAGVVSAVVMPEIVASSSRQFGAIGVAFALLSWLTSVAIVIMGCAVVGAELADRGGAASRLGLREASW